MRPIDNQPGVGGPEQQGGEIAVVSLARVEQVTGVPEFVPMLLGLVILVWAVVRSARRGPDDLDGRD
jgi:hypothetical protein